MLDRINQLKLKFWPWNKIQLLENKISKLNVELAKERDQHAETKSQNVALKGEIKIHQDRSAEREKHMRKMVNIIAIKGGIIQ